MTKKTTISLSCKTVAILKRFGKKGETYDEIIWKLLRLWVQEDQARRSSTHRGSSG